VLRAVGLDRTFYAPMTREQLAALTTQVPAGFRFVMKALETATVGVFPRHPRYGAQAGQENPLFFDAAHVTNTLLRPAMDGLGAWLGAVVFQLPPQSPMVLGGPARFAMRLRAFLRDLPAGPTYAVEVRNRELLSLDLARALADHGAVPCLTVHPSMPSLDVQAAALAPALTGPLVIRWMLGGGQDYEAARDRYAPFDRIIDPDPDTRARIVGLVARAPRPAYVLINNKAEGSAPASAVLLARALVAG
jgi:uncharacterized protein YecE (DUF72 family)